MIEALARLGVLAALALSGWWLATAPAGGLTVRHYLEPPEPPPARAPTSPGLERAGNRWSGWLEAAASRTCTLTTTTSGSVLVAVDGRAVLTHWQPHAAPVRQGGVYLARGLHAVSIECDTAPDVRWDPPVAFAHGGARAPGNLPRPGSRLLAEERVPRIAFTHPEPLALPYITRWRAATMGHPAELAPLAATFDGTLDVPAPATLVVEGTGEVTLSAGDESVSKSFEATSARLELGAGNVPLHLAVRDPGVLRRLVLSWKLGNADAEPVPAARFRVEDRAGPASLAVPGLALALALAAPGLFASAGARRFAAWAVLVFAGAALRLDGYALTPPPFETNDEFAHHTIGGALVAGGVPWGWDFREGYAMAQLVPVHGHTYNMVAPLVEWPPAMSALTGLVARAAGATSPLDMPLEATRLVPIALSLVTLALVWPVGRALKLSHGACFWATALAAVYPIQVLLARLIKEDNLLAPLYLATAWLLARGPLERSAARRWTLGALAVLALLTKQMGIACAALAGLSAFRRRAWRPFALSIGFAVLGVLAFAWYGLAHAGPWWLALQAKLGGFAGKVDALTPLVATSRITETELGTGWIVGLWIAFVAFAFAPASRARGRRLLVTAVLVYLVVLVLSYPAQFNFGWYRLPLFPFLFLAAGDQCTRMIARFDPLRVLVWAGLFLWPTLDLMGSAPPGTSPAVGFLPPDWRVGWPRAALIVRCTVFAFVIPSLMLPALPRPPRRWLARALGLALAWSVVAAFALAAWSWPDLHPYARSGDAVMPP